MRTQHTDSGLLRRMILSAAAFLEKNKQAVNSLNVFPVPDGDTGTNMSLTVMSAVKEISVLPENAPMAELVTALSRGALKGARGNSGVILSQLFRGFAEHMKTTETLDTKQLALAFQKGVETAYKAVMKPVEGTILTVARVTADRAKTFARREDDIEEFLTSCIEVARDTLEKPPDLLDVLKEAGVVDAGGMGLLYLFIGARNVYTGELDLDDLIAEAGIPGTTAQEFEEGIENGYCTEFIIENIHPYIELPDDVGKLQDKLGNLGDSIVAVYDEDLIKIHVHTEMPGKVLQLGLRFGELTNIKIDNMRHQHRHLEDVKREEEKKPCGVLAVAMGEGLSQVFTELGVDYIIQGGQTMNPSIEDILNGIDEVNAEDVYVLPNNPNIILSAQQAADISGSHVHVIHSKSIPQGMAAMLAYNPDDPPKANVEHMEQSMETVLTGQVTYAVRDSEMNGFKVKEGDIIGLCGKEIKASGDDVNATTMHLIKSMGPEEKEVMTIFYGSDMTEEQANTLTEEVEKEYPQMEIQTLPGGQPLYYYIISVE